MGKHMRKGRKTAIRLSPVLAAPLVVLALGASGASAAEQGTASSVAVKGSDPCQITACIPGDPEQGEPEVSVPGEGAGNKPHDESGDRPVQEGADSVVTNPVGGEPEVSVPGEGAGNKPH